MEDAKLDRSQIVQTALQMMQNEGIEALTMRKLAARLHIRAPTLYWYFPDRSAIMREVIKTLLAGTIERVGNHATWQEWLRSFGEELWSTNRQFPYVTMLLQSIELNDQEIFALATGLLDEKIKHYGVDRMLFMRVHSDIQALVLGWAVFRQAGVVGRIEPLFDVDNAIREAIAGIIVRWDAATVKAGARQAK